MRWFRTGLFWSLWADYSQKVFRISWIPLQIAHRFEQLSIQLLSVIYTLLYPKRNELLIGESHDRPVGVPDFKYLGKINDFLSKKWMVVSILWDLKKQKRETFYRANI